MIAENGLVFSRLHKRIPHKKPTYVHADELSEELSQPGGVDEVEGVEAMQGLTVVQQHPRLSQEPRR